MVLGDDFTPPTRFDEYRLLRPLGSGAMGQVFLCMDTLLDRQVAVKFLRQAYRDPAGRERFFNEARAIARLAHTNVVSIYRVGEVGGLPYLVSEFVSGKSLEKLTTPIAWPEVLRIGIGVARGLAAAHQKGVLHRDIKPANLILAEDQTVKLLDFGLAKLVSAAPTGTPASPAPEPPKSAPSASSLEVVPARGPSGLRQGAVPA